MAVLWSCSFRITSYLLVTYRIYVMFGRLPSCDRSTACCACAIVPMRSSSVPISATAYQIISGMSYAWKTTPAIRDYHFTGAAAAHKLIRMEGRRPMPQFSPSEFFGWDHPPEGFYIVWVTHKLAWIQLVFKTWGFSKDQLEFVYLW